MRDGQKRDFARGLRRTMTDAERRLWHHLRNRALMGWKFRRQHAVGPYIVDFICVEGRLVVELDGGQHAGSRRDAIRTRHLEAAGFRVLRFWNDDVLTGLEPVLDAIHRAVRRAPSPQPSPACGRGGLNAGASRNSRSG